MGGLSLSVGLKKKLEIALGRNDWTAADVDRITQGDTLSRIRNDYLKEMKLFRPGPLRIYITEGDGRTASQLIDAGQYSYVDPSLRTHTKSVEFRMSTTYQDVGIALVEFSTDLEIGAIWDRIARSEFERPMLEDAIRIGEQHRNLFLERPIIFAHRPWVGDDDRCRLAVLDMRNGRDRLLTSCDYGYPWPKSCLFAVRRDLLPRWDPNNDAEDKPKAELKAA